MPQPSVQIEQTRPDIAGSLEQFDVEANNNKMIATQLFPVFEVDEQAGKFGEIPAEQMLEDSDTSRQSGGGYNRGNYTFRDNWYATEENGWEEPVDRRNARIYRNYFDAEMVAAKRGRSKVLINMEKRVADKTLNNSNIIGAAGGNWTDKTAAVIMTNVETAVLAIYNRTGLWPNCIVMSYLLFRHVRRNNEIVDLLEGSGAGDRSTPTDIVAQRLSEVFDLKHVLIAGASRNTAGKNQALSVAQVWGSTSALVCTVAESNDIQEPCIGRTFHWGEDGSNIGGMVESYYEVQTRSDIIRNRMDTHEKEIYLECAQRITGLAG